MSIGLTHCVSVEFIIHNAEHNASKPRTGTNRLIFHHVRIYANKVEFVQGTLPFRTPYILTQPYHISFIHGLLVQACDLISTYHFLPDSVQAGGRTDPSSVLRSTTFQLPHLISPLSVTNFYSLATSKTAFTNTCGCSSGMFSPHPLTT